VLVLSRKIGESILIGGEIEIKVLKIEKNAVKIGVDAPKRYKVYRKELYEKIMKENIEATKTDVIKLKGVLNFGEGDRRPSETPSGSVENRPDG
jgi:carbon storage regulator